MGVWVYSPDPTSIVRVTPASAGVARTVDEREIQMTLIKFLADKTVAFDGLHVQDFEAGAEVDAPVQFAKAFVDQGIAVVVDGSPVVLALAPDQPPNRGISDVEIQVFELGPDATRKELDHYAAGLGINTKKLPNKEMVWDAIHHAESGAIVDAE